MRISLQMASGESWQQWCFQLGQQQFLEYEQQQFLAPSPEFKIFDDYDYGYSHETWNKIQERLILSPEKGVNT